MYPIKHINPDLAENLEPLGTKRKYWFREPASVAGQPDTRVLFKAEERGTGEDWAEKITCELAALLDLPHVHYDLAMEIGTDKPGVVCASCVGEPWALVLGNQVLGALDDAYPVRVGRKFKVKAHTVEAVSGAVGLLRPPPDPWMAHAPEGILTASDVFVGYVMLDAWTANQDRHHENWGALWDGQTVALAPTFDHGSGLARNLTDETRKARLATSDRNYGIPFFARRADSAFFADPQAGSPMTTHEAWRAFAARAQGAAAIWRERLGAINAPTVRAILEEVPPGRMTAVCRDFTMALLSENRRRILEETGE